MQICLVYKTNSIYITSDIPIVNEIESIITEDIVKYICLYI